MTIQHNYLNQQTINYTYYIFTYWQIQRKDDGIMKSVNNANQLTKTDRMEGFVYLSVILCIGAIILYKLFMLLF